MKDLKIKPKFKILDFLTSKGFYLTLIVSLTLLGSTIWVVMNKSIDNVVDKNLKLIKNNNLKTVNNVVDNIPVDNISIVKKTKNKKDDLNNYLEEEKNNSIDNLENQDDLNTEIENSNILFVSPLFGNIINDFSCDELVKNKTLSDWRVHNAIDIAAQQGTPVKSIADGEIIKIYDHPMLGTCIEIEHAENINSVYCSLNKNVNVKEGDIVEAGSVIGSVGNTAIGESELGSHLHLEIKEKGKKINPLSKIKIS